MNDESDIVPDHFDPTFQPCLDYMKVGGGGDRQIDTADAESRATIRDLAMHEMAKLAKLPGAFIRADELKAWRPTHRVRGDLTCGIEAVTCVATDGLLGLFVFDAAHERAGQAFKAHVAGFKWHFAYVTESESLIDGEWTLLKFRSRKGKPPALFSASTALTIWYNSKCGVPDGTPKIYWSDEYTTEGRAGKRSQTSAERARKRAELFAMI